MKQKICLVDGSGYIFRAFYGLPPMSSPEGVPVNAVYGFTNMFLKLTQKISCDYCLVLFDAKRKNYRNEIFADYKATRKDTPEDLIPQFPIIREAVDALNLNHMEMEGYEADDLIATYAKKALEQNMDVVIVSADKDLMQLIEDGVEFYEPMKDKFFTPEDVREKFGVLPDRVIDVQALAGDAIDNIPGVPGIGLKTAALLVNEYGSLDSVLARASEIKQNKRRETLLANIDNAKMSLQLVTLKKDVPVEQEISEFICKSPDAKVVDDFVSKYSFNGLRSRLAKWVSERCQSMSEGSVSGSVKADDLVADVPFVMDSPKAVVVKKYELVQTLPALQKWADKIRQAGVFAFDTETTGLSYVFDKIVGISLSTAEGEACYIPVAHKSMAAQEDLFSSPSEEVRQLSVADVSKVLKPLFTSKSILKIGHNIKFDMLFLTQVFGTEMEICPIDDTAIISYVLNSSEHGHSLDELASLYLGYDTVKFEDVCGKGKAKITFDMVELDKALDYAAEDADITLRLYNILKPKLVSSKLLDVYEYIDRPLISILSKMEQEGIRVDSKELNVLKSSFIEEIASIEKDIYEIAGEEFNVASPKQVGEVLFDKQGLKGKKTPTGGWQTGADVLETLADAGNALAAKILEWRTVSKLKSTYTDSLLTLLDKNDRVHSSFSQIVANTGRLASSNPNLQNIPIRSERGKKIRACFVVKEGCKIIAADYSQVELRLLACVADVKALKEAFEQGIDIHTQTAAKVFGLDVKDVTKDIRSHAKAINFGIVYGISEFGLAKQIGVSRYDAKEYIDSYFKQMPEIKAYMAQTVLFAQENGFVVTPFGRKCSISGINDNNKNIAMNAQRAAINAPIQGGAADIIKLAMKNVKKALADGGYQTKLMLQVHDELVFESPVNEAEEVAQIIKTAMENAVDLCVKFVSEVGVGDNWSEAH